MATWKKVIVSGSSAALAALQVDNLTSGSVVIGGGSTANLSVTAINGTGNIVATTGATNLVATGSFSGSFSGSFFGTTNLPDLTQGTGISTFTYDGSTTATVSVSGAAALTNNQMTKWSGSAFQNSSLNDNGTTITGTTSLQLTGTSTSLTGSFTGSHFGPLTGTASFATSASYAFQATSASYAQQATSASYALVATSASYALQATSASYALQATSASFASTAAQVNNALTFGTGLSGSISTYNGSAAATFAISGSATLSSNLIPKWTGTGLANTNITDTGTQVQIGAGASSGMSVAAGGVNVTGNSTFNNNLTVTGDLTVNGTASFVNSDNLYVKDKFILINSGSSTLADSGIIVAYSTGSGTGPSCSAIFLEAASAGTYGRWAFAYDVIGTATSVTADEYAVSAKIGQASAPGAATPTWGGATNGTGNMWVTTAGDIFIYS